MSINTNTNNTPFNNTLGNMNPMDISSSNTNHPNINNPNTNYPNTNCPNINNPYINNPNLQYPIIQYPIIQYPNIQYPYINYSNTNNPNTSKASTSKASTVSNTPYVSLKQRLLNELRNYFQANPYIPQLPSISPEKRLSDLVRQGKQKMDANLSTTRNDYISNVIEVSIYRFCQTFNCASNKAYTF